MVACGKGALDLPPKQAAHRLHHIEPETVRPRDIFFRESTGPELKGTNNLHDAASTASETVSLRFNYTRSGGGERGKGRKGGLQE